MFRRRSRGSRGQGGVVPGGCYEGGVGVPEGQEVLANGFVYLLFAEAPGVAGACRSIERPAQGVGALLLEDLPRVYHVPAALAHLLALRVEDVTEHHARPV